MSQRYRFIWGLVFAVFFQVGYAQISTTHYIPPIIGVQYSITSHKLVLSTLTEEPFLVTVTNSDGSFFEEVMVGKNTPQEIPLNHNGGYIGYPFVRPDGSVAQNHLDSIYNRVFTNQGLIVTGDQPFFANIMTEIPSQGEILTSKGIAGQGRLFYTGHQHMNWVSQNENQQKSHFTSVMAVEDNTEIEFYNPRVLFHGQSQHRFQITLNAGESYAIGNTTLAIQHSCGTTAECTNDHNGTKITSNKNITVNSGSIHGGYSNSEFDVGRDIGFDQIAPIEYAGREFILIEGNGTSANKDNEVAIVVATQANTTIHVNGQSDPANTFHIADEGGYAIIPWEKYTSNTLFISTDKDAFVYQTLAGSSSSVSPGMMFIPRITLDATKEIYVSGVGSLGTPSLFLMTKEGAQVKINDIEISSSTSILVEGAPGWVAYRILDLNPYGGQFSDFYVQSTEVLNAAVSFVDVNIGGGGYYSGFSKDISNAGVGTMGIEDFTLFCPQPIDLIAQGGISYEWSAVDPDHWQYLSKTSDSTYTFTPTQDLEYGLYQYQVITSVELINSLREDTTILSISYQEFDQTFGGTQRVCTDQSTQLNPLADSKFDEYYLWENIPQLNQTQIASPLFTGEMSLKDQRVPVDVSFDDGYCQFDGTVEVIVEDCRRPRIQNAWVYDLDSNGRAETFKIKFNDVFSDFDNITSIDWTSEGVDSRNSAEARVVYDTLSDGSVDSTSIILSFDNQFAFGTTADTNLIPYVNYYFDSVQVIDRIGPVVALSEKVYPEDKYYGIKKVDGSIEYHESPVEVHVKVSEVIVVDSSDYQRLFVFKDAQGEVLDIQLLEAPTLGEDGLTWVLKIDPAYSDLIPLIHTTTLNPQTSIEDLQGNVSHEYNQGVIEDNDSPYVQTYQQFRENIVGDRIKDVVNFNGAQVNIYDEEGNLLERIPHQTKIESKWVAPYNFINGKIDPNAPCVDNQVITEFPPTCLASLILGSYKSKGAYQATSYIYDHLGQFVTKISQKFGYCGELDNPSRAQLSSNQHLLLNDLIWDLKDTQGRKVGVGVYVWKVLIEFENGDKETIIQRMGTMRESEVCQE